MLHEATMTSNNALQANWRGAMCRLFQASEGRCQVAPVHKGKLNLLESC